MLFILVIKTLIWKTAVEAMMLSNRVIVLFVRIWIAIVLCASDLNSHKEFSEMLKRQMELVHKYCDYVYLRETTQVTVISSTIWWP